MALRLIPLALASVLIAAHFFRGGHAVFALICLLVPFLLLIRRRWSLIVVQLSLYGATVIWLLATIDVIRDRLMSARPWTRPAIILGSVALFTMFAGMLLNSSRVKDKYSRRYLRDNFQ